MTRLRELRKSKKLSMKTFGEIFNLSESTISLYETGKHDPDLETMIRFADFFKVSLDYLVGRTNNPSISRNDVLVNSKNRIVSLKETGLAREDLERITNVIDDIKQKYEQLEPSVLAAHSDEITAEEMQDDINKMKEFIRRQNDSV